MDINDLRPEPATYARIRTLMDDAKSIHDDVQAELEEYGITDTTPIEGVLFASDDLTKKASAFITDLANLPPNEFKFLSLCMQDNLDERTIEKARGNASDYFLQDLSHDMRIAGKALEIISCEDDEKLTARHFYIAAHAYQRSSIKVCLSQDELDPEEQAAQLGVTFIPLTPEDNLRLSDDKKRLNEIFALLSKSQKTRMNTSLENIEDVYIPPFEYKTAETLMRHINGNNIFTATQAGAYIMHAVLPACEGCKEPSYLFFDAKLSV